MIKEVNGKKYIFMQHDNKKSYVCPTCAGWKTVDLCKALNDDCDGGYFSEADDRTPEVTVTNQEQPTLRDQFAMAIITGKIYCFRSDTQDEQDDYAQRVYALADSIMKARAK